MAYFQGVDLLAHKSISQYSQFWIGYYLIKCPKLGIQLPNAGDDNQSYHILTVIFNLIGWLRVPEYNVYSSTILYKNVLISTYLWGCANIKLHISTKTGTVCRPSLCQY